MPHNWIKISIDPLHVWISTKHRLQKKIIIICPRGQQQGARGHQVGPQWTTWAHRPVLKIDPLIEGSPIFNFLQHCSVIVDDYLDLRGENHDLSGEGYSIKRTKVSGLRRFLLDSDHTARGSVPLYERQGSKSGSRCQRLQGSECRWKGAAPTPLALSQQSAQQPERENKETKETKARTARLFHQRPIADLGPGQGRQSAESLSLSQPFICNYWRQNKENI